MRLPLSLTILTALAAPAGAATLYMIDIDTTRTSDTTTTGGPLFTMAGWTSLDVTNPVNANGASVTLDGVAISIASADSSRIRSSGGSATPNDLTGDFVFDDGAGQAVIMIFGVAGSLQAGTWKVDAWSWDSTIADFATNTQIAGFRRNGAETIVSTTVVPDPVNPAVSFTFTSDGVGAYDFFFRDNSTFDRTRLNAVRLELIPEPGMAALLGFAGLALAGRRNRARKV